MSDVEMKLSLDEARTLAEWAYRHGSANGWTGTTGKVASILIRLRGQNGVVQEEQSDP